MIPYFPFSQGKSRVKNPVELTHCRDHRSYYVALSRGTTAEGTIIVQGFSAKKITSGMSGYLRQELRELEILDEITKLRFEGKLPRTVTGLYRRRLLRSFYAWKTDHRDPPHYHPALRWDSSMGPRVPEPQMYGEWRPSLAASKSKKNVAVGASNALSPGSDNIYLLPIREHSRPVGFIWDSQNHSCGYDATFTILSNVWAEDPNKWAEYFNHLSPLMGELATALQTVVEGSTSLEQAYGPNTTSIDRIAETAITGYSSPICLRG
ncbi:hypothetical protein C8F04DRAFT_1122503 [Mycena alexandri]|uniref:Uncharacterized protein n=1 Tax=Mycena alexandri TaxID=1745969 RepID=A0AAD6SI79_9AGAR|nr:hypothetical protein C8F04DRAFT_1122503 [Mycena alexandri]